MRQDTDDQSQRLSAETSAPDSPSDIDGCVRLNLSGGRNRDAMSRRSIDAETETRAAEVGDQQTSDDDGADLRSDPRTRAFASTSLPRMSVLTRERDYGRDGGGWKGGAGQRVDEGGRRRVLEMSCKRRPTGRRVSLRYEQLETTHEAEVTQKRGSGGR